MFCPKCYQKIGDKSNFCKHCGASLQNLQNITTPEPSGGNFWFGVLSFFEPIVGFVFFGVWRKKRPRRAKVCGINSLVSVALALFFLLPVISDTIKKMNPPAPPVAEERWEEWIDYPFFGITGYELDNAEFENSEDGRLVFHKIIEDASVRFDTKSDFVAAWRGNMIKIYENFEEKLTLRYDEPNSKRKVEVFNDSPQVADVALHNGKLAVAFKGLEKKIIVHDLRTDEARLFVTQKGVARIAITDGAIAYLENQSSVGGEAHIIYMQTGKDVELGESAGNLWFDEQGETLFLYGAKDSAFSVADRSLQSKTQEWSAIEQDGKVMRLYVGTFHVETESIIKSTVDVVDISHLEWTLERVVYHKAGCYAIIQHDNGFLVYDFRQGKIVYSLEGINALSAVSVSKFVEIDEGKFLIYCGRSGGYLATLDLSGIVE